METSSSLIEKLLTYFGVHTNIELAGKLGITKQTLTNWKTRNALSAIKKKCRELGIYNEIFNSSYSEFNQIGNGNQQIGNQNNHDSSNINSFDSNSVEKEKDNSKIDKETLNLIEALISVSVALDKKEELKNEIKLLLEKMTKL
jgi:hypothetical protein